MRHPGEDELVLHHYGEGSAREAVERHLESCDQCRASYQALRRVLGVVQAPPVPEPGPEFEAVVWARLQPRLEEERPAPWWASLFQVRRLALAGSIAVLVVAAFVAGRLWPRPEPAAPAPSSATAANKEQVRDRILLVAVEDHLQRSQMVLVELMNAGDDGTVDISAERELAETLVADNRLYRQTAAGVGETGMASVLEDLERVLLEIAHGPSQLSGPELDAFRERLESDGIVFKVRVLGSRVREREGASVRRMGVAES